VYQIRYLTDWKEGDAWLCRAKTHDFGIWVTRRRMEDGEFTPQKFTSELEAKRYLYDRKYDLPSDQVVIEIDSVKLGA
jgi:hypothetical protein